MSISDQTAWEKDFGWKYSTEETDACLEKSPKGNVVPKTPYYDSFYVTSKFPPYTAESLYGSSELIAPEGWEFTGEFRKGLVGETILLTVPRVAYTLLNDSVEAPRLILRKKPNLLDEKLRLYGKDYKIPAGYKEISFGRIKTGNFIFDPGDKTVYKASKDEVRYITEPRIILEKLPLRKRYIFEETGEEKRYLENGDWGIHDVGSFVNHQASYQSLSKYRPVTLKIEEF